MVYQRWLWSPLPTLVAVSYSSLAAARRPHLRSKVYFAETGETTNTLKKNAGSKGGVLHMSHHGVPAIGRHASALVAQQKQENGDMVVAGKKEDVQRDNGEIYSGIIPNLSQPLVESPPSAAPLALGTAVQLASAPLSSPTASVSVSASSQEQGQVSTASSVPLASSAAAPSRSTSLPFPPAFLAFILLPVSLLLIVMIIAITRMYRRPETQLPLASSLFLGDATSIGSENTGHEAIALSKPRMTAREPILRRECSHGSAFKQDTKGEQSYGGESMPERNTFKDTRASQLPKNLAPSHVTAPNHRSSRSRVVRPYVPRPYHRPHSAYIADPESIMPLMTRTGLENSSGRGVGNKGEHESIDTKLKGKGKENIRPDKAIPHGRRHQDTLAIPAHKFPSRPLPSKDFTTSESSSVDAQHPLKSDYSSVSVFTHSFEDQDAPPPPPTTTSLEIGLAMLKGFSSPTIGLGLDLSPRPEQDVQEDGRDITGMNMRDEGSSSHMGQSTSLGSKGLAYLASDSSRSLMLPEKRNELRVDTNEDELDIASALAVYRVQHDVRNSERAAKEQVEGAQVAKLGHQESPGTSPETLSPAFSSFKTPPMLPTLSEMALSRADPLYESVTNELFSSYGMRMSTANGGGRMSRVSARISRMLSWFGDTSAEDRIPDVGNKMNTEEVRTSREVNRNRVSNFSTVGGVQPLRIGKVRKGPV